MYDFSGDIIDYWIARCKAAEKCIAESPNDPDITNNQIQAHTEWQQLKNKYKNGNI